MNTKMYRVVPCMLGLALCLSGCAGFVGGDLHNIKSDYQMPVCKDAAAHYQVRYRSDAKDDGGDQNIAGFISNWTLTIIPTYWRSTVHSEATVFCDGKPVYTGQYTSHVDKFYGMLWGFILLPFESGNINALQADEGGGIRVEWGIRDRTLRKVVSDCGGREDQFCLLDEHSIDTPANTALKPAPSTP